MIIDNNYTLDAPQMKGVGIPKIVEVMQPVNGQDVNHNVVSPDSDKSVLLVAGKYFSTFDEAEKKLLTESRKYIKRVCKAAALFNIDNFSDAADNTSLKWLLETYELDEIHETFSRPTVPVEHGTWAYLTPVSQVFFDVYPQLVRSDCMFFKKLEAVHHWSWLQNRDFNSECIPREYEVDGPLRISWVEGEASFDNKIILINKLVNLRILELLYLDGRYSSEVPLQELVDNLDLELIAHEIQDMYDVMNQAELGKDLRIGFSNGEVVYSAKRNKLFGAPFKKF